MSPTGGSQGDNGQTGRKLVMDFYGPRIPIGGGALHGKHYAHIDRLGAMAARRLALDLVKRGAKDALVKLCYGPGIDEPLSVDVNSTLKPERDEYKHFNFREMLKYTSSWPTCQAGLKTSI